MPLASINIRLGLNDKAFVQGLDRAQRKLNRFSRKMSRIGDQLSTTVSLPLVGIGVAALQSAAKIGALEKSMESMLGSSAAARVEIDKLREASQLPGLGFEQAIRGSLRLQSVGIEAEQAREILVKFGNAVALAGGGAAELDGVTLALTQIISKGKISAEEINQLAERIPQVRAAITNAFGTADSEQLQKLGVGVEEFVSKVTAEIGKLPKAQQTLKNVFENTVIAAQVALSKVGEEINKAFNLTGKLDKLSKFIMRLADAFAALSGPTKKAILVMVALTAAIGPLFAVFGRLSAAVAVLLSPMGLMVAGLVAIAGAVVYAYNKSQKFRAVLNGLASAAKEAFNIIALGVTKMNVGFKALKMGEFRAALKAFGSINLSPTGFASSGKSLADAFQKGFAEEMAKPDQDVKKAADFFQNDFKFSAAPTAGGGGKRRPRISEVSQIEGISLPTFLEPPQNIEEVQSKMKAFNNPIYQLSDAMDLLNTKNVVFGQSFDLVGQKIALVKDTMMQMIEQGFSPTSSGITLLTEELAALNAEATAMEKMKESAAAIGDAFLNAANAVESGNKSIVASTLGAVAKVIKAHIQQAIAAQVAKVFATVPFPLNVALAAGAGAAVGGLMNKLMGAVGIPALAKGGLAFGPTLAMVGDNPGARSNPEVIAPLNKLKDMMGNGAGGKVNVSGTFRVQGTDLLLVLERAQQDAGRLRGY